MYFIQKNIFVVFNVVKVVVSIPCMFQYYHFFLSLHFFCFMFFSFFTAAALFSCIPVCKIGLFLFISFDFFSFFLIFFSFGRATRLHGFAFSCKFPMECFFSCHLFFAFSFALTLVSAYRVCVSLLVVSLIQKRTCSLVGNFYLKHEGICTKFCLT